MSRPGFRSVLVGFLTLVLVAVGAMVFGAWAGRRGGDGFTDPPDPICRTRRSTQPNVRTDCEFTRVRHGMVFSNETSIAVNPTRPANIVAAADDNQILLTGKTSEADYAFSRVRVSDDGGSTWSSHRVDWGRNRTSDVQVAFDAGGRAYLAVIGRIEDANPDIFVTHSADGGRHWSGPRRVAAGSGTDVEGISNDKVALAAWGHGNALVAWARYRMAGGYAGSPIVASVTHDGGGSWSSPVEVSGSAPFCVGTGGDHACDQAQNPQPVVTPDGRLMLSFVASHKSGVAGNIDPNTLMVVELDSASGTRRDGPFPVAALADAASGYPVSDLYGLPTLHDSEFVASSLGTITADPTNPGHLAEVWSDMRNTASPVSTDPYSAVTNSDVVVAQSFDLGRTWGAAVTLAAPGDQFQPSATYDRSGRLRIGYLDRSYDPANHLYGYTLASEQHPGSLSFDTRRVSTALSDPTRDAHFFAQTTVNPAFPHPTRLIGDNTALAATPEGVIAYWTDLRGRTCFGGRCGGDQGTYVANLP